MKFFPRNIGHLILIIAVVGLMAVNATLLYRTQDKVSDEKQAAEEAAKPAEIQLTILSAPDCTECYDIATLVGPLKAGDKVQVTKEETVQYTSTEGAALLQKYGITRVPTVLVQGETDKAFDTASFLQNIGKKGEDGTLVVTNTLAPYLDVASGKIEGTFTVTFLTDKGCKECYDPAVHRQALAGLAMKPSEEKFVDRADADGKALIAKYQIDSAPTILLSGDLNAYPRFGQVWPSVGTVEKDGTHIFRSGQAVMGVYHDLNTGKIVKPKAPEPVPTETPAPAPASPSK